MQTKPTKKPLILLLLLLVLLGEMTYAMAQSGYLQGILRSGSFGFGGGIVTETDSPGMSYANPADGAEAFADEVAGYAADAETAKEDAATAAQSGDDDALETAISAAQTAADNAQSSYDQIAAYLSRAETQSESAAQDVTDGIDRQALAQDFVDLAETAYNEKIEPAVGSDWEGAFEASDDYDTCMDGGSMFACSSEENALEDAKWDICIDYYQTTYLAECGMLSSAPTFSSNFENVFDDAKTLFETWVDLQSNFDENYTGSYLTDLQDTADEKAADLTRAQAADAAAAADLEAAQTAATNAAKYQILTCTSLTIDPTAYEMASTDTEASFDFSVEIVTGEQGSPLDLDGVTIVPVNGLNDLLAIGSFRTSTPSITPTIEVGSLNLGSNYEYWSGTLLVEAHSQDGELTYGTRTDTSFEIDLTEADTLNFSFSGGQAGDTIDISVDGQTLRCSESIAITQASDPTHGLGELSDTDTDGDGLTDREEGLHRTDSTLADTDGDGISDGDEVDAGTNPLVDEAALATRGTLDTDSDGLTGDEEVANGTKYDVSDTDGDGLLDGDEVNTYLTDPLDEDSDSDELSDYDEVITYLTDPNDSDTDGDTYSDSDEITASTDPLDATDYPGVTVEDPVEDPVEPSDEVPTLTRDIILADYTCTDSFQDTKGEWHEDIICRAKEAGWVKGYTTLIFGPDGDITRAEYVKVLTKIFGLDEEDGYDGKVGFYDVATTDWYYPYINLAENKDWIRTRDAGYNFNPNTPITRADAILWAIRAADQSTYTYDVEDTFNDVENSDYFAYALAIANSTLVDTAEESNQPIVEGYTDGSFGPYKNIARSEAMAIATRIAIAWGVASEDWDE